MHKRNYFGTYFSDVNIHKDSKQAPSLSSLGFTQGNDVHFAPGQYNPGSQKGQELLGHELAHVVQQREGRVKPDAEQPASAKATAGTINTDPALEKEADEQGKQAAQGKMANVKGKGSAVQREGDEMDTTYYKEYKNGDIVVNHEDDDGNVIISFLIKDKKCNEESEGEEEEDETYWTKGGVRYTGKLGGYYGNNENHKAMYFRTTNIDGIFGNVSDLAGKAANLLYRNGKILSQNGEKDKNIKKENSGSVEDKTDAKGKGKYKTWNKINSCIGKTFQSPEGDSILRINSQGDSSLFVPWGANTRAKVSTDKKQ